MSAVVTGEAVVIELDAARVPTRAIAFGIDATIQLVLLALGTFLVTGATLQLDDAAAAAAVIVLLVVVLVGYPILWETLTRGRSPGKAALGLRVVRDDGGPVTFRHALVRALLAVFVDLWLTAGTVGVVVSLSSARGKRVGDVLAGTFVIHDRVRQRASATPDLPPELAGWTRSLDLSGMTDELWRAAVWFLSRRRELADSVRAGRATDLANAVVTRVGPAPPVGLSAETFLAAVVAERRRREHERLAGINGATQHHEATPRADRDPATRDDVGSAGSSYGPSGFTPPS